MSSIEIIITILGGFLAGCINTLSGNGSIITLGIMTELLGMNPQLANGTNRIGLLSQGIFSLVAFKKNHDLKVGDKGIFIMIGILAALCGAWTSVYIDPTIFKIVYKILMILMLMIIIIKPEKYFVNSQNPIQLPTYLYVILFAILGFYGGFIQLGMGVFFVFIMSFLLHYNIIDSNIIKIIMVSSYTLLIIFIFQWNQMIDWKVGIILASGQSMGGFLMAYYSSRMKNLEKFVYYLFLIVVSLTVAKLLFQEYL